jgi:hypothetical protein
VRARATALICRISWYAITVEPECQYGSMMDTPTAVKTKLAMLCAPCRAIMYVCHDMLRIKGESKGHSFHLFPVWYAVTVYPAWLCQCADYLCSSASAVGRVVVSHAGASLTLCCS